MEARSIAALVFTFAALACDALVGTQFTVRDAVCSSDDDCLMNTACDIGPNTCRACRTGFDDCDGNRANGCEVDTSEDPSNCGSCGEVCPPPNASATCAVGACAISACNNGFGDCNATLTDGCETAFASDLANCGSCGNVCPTPPPNAFATCAVGTCAINVCDDGFGDCNANSTDGCEAAFASDAANCGKCGNVCGGGSNCIDQACGPPMSCAEIKSANPNAASGIYMIDPDGSGALAPVDVNCDMTTSGGGWTIVFASAGDYNQTDLPYRFTGAIQVVAGATKMMVAHRSAVLGVTGDYGIVTIPSDWKSASPFTFATGEANVSAERYNSEGMLLATVSGVAYYGYKDWHAMCGNAPWEASQLRGQFCISGTTLPAYNNFAQAQADSCVSTSSGSYVPSCSADLRFTLAVK